MIIDNSRLQSHIMYALSDSHMHKILQSTLLSVKSVTEIIREQDLPHSSAYKKIAELVKWGLLVSYKSELIEGKKVAYYKSTFHSIKISYEGIAENKGRSRTQSRCSGEHLNELLRFVRQNG